MLTPLPGLTDHSSSSSQTSFSFNFGAVTMGDKMFIVALFILLASGSALRIEVTPPIYTEESTGPVIVSCYPDADDVGTSDVYLMEIKRGDEKPIVFLRALGLSHSPETFIPSKMQVEGTIDADVSKTYLRLTVSDPREDDKGLYTCVMFFSDDSGLLNERRASSNFEVEIMDVHRVIKSLLAKVAFLEEKASYTTGFSAGLKTDVDVPVGDVIVFNDVITNYGNSYDGTTGLFTAPKAGLYSFNLVLMARCTGCQIKAQLKVNDEGMAKLYANDDQHWDQSSVGCVQELKPGDVVKVVVINYAAKINSWNGKGSLFSGHLIKAF